ncbi:MAG: glutamate--cysteine ligase [Pseudomonadota bacterium]
MADPSTQSSAPNQISERILNILAAPESGSQKLQRGIEKESLRVNLQGELSRQTHPETLGSPLTHPEITTDFSEAQLELITDVHDNPQACLTQLTNIHQFVHQGIDQELLWPSSMPCLVGNDEDIPLGQYGTSHIGRAKTIYRHGLGVRYGRLMQTISGIHYNFSLPTELWQALGIHSQDDVTDAYFGLIRNFRRWSWLLLYLFGASPAVCRSFTKNIQHQLTEIDEGSQYLPHATSLRMGPLGYQSNAQSALHISYNSLGEYARSMQSALTTDYQPYANHGVLLDGHYQQLNTAILQIENEFYGTIRPKRTIRTGERPINALRERGVEYVEVRCMDLNPFVPIGIDAQTIRFLDVFLITCLVAQSQPDSKLEIARLQANQLAVVERGRDPDLVLQLNESEEISLRRWAIDLMSQCRQVAQALDQANNTTTYRDTTDIQTQKINDPELTPSAQVLKQMREEKIPFFRFSMNKAVEHAEYFARTPLSPDQLADMRQVAEHSFTAQKEIEAADTRPFEEFLEEYLSL